MVPTPVALLDWQDVLRLSKHRTLAIPGRSVKIKAGPFHGPEMKDKTGR